MCILTAYHLHRKSYRPANGWLFRFGPGYGRLWLKVKLFYAYKLQSSQYRTRSSEIAFLHNVLVWLSTWKSCQLNLVSDYAIAQYRTNASEIAHLVGTRSVFRP